MKPSTCSRGLRAEWRRLARVLADPAVELDADEFASVYSLYMRMKSAGLPIDPMAEALIRQGAYDMILTLSATPAIDSGYLSLGQAAKLRALLIDDPDTSGTVRADNDLRPAQQRNQQ